LRAAGYYQSDDDSDSDGQRERQRREASQAFTDAMAPLLLEGGADEDELALNRAIMLSLQAEYGTVSREEADAFSRANANRIRDREAAAAAAAAAAGGAGGGGGGAGASFFSSSDLPLPPPQAQAQAEPTDSDLSLLTSLGFPLHAARTAWALAGGDMDAAANILLNGGVGGS
jgi:hypothetical protein